MKAFRKVFKDPFISSTNGSCSPASHPVRWLTPDTVSDMLQLQAHAEEAPLVEYTCRSLDLQVPE